MAALVAPISSTAPSIPIHTYHPRISITSITSPSLSSPEESALGVLAQVAHELEPTKCPSKGDYFSEPNILPPDLAELLLHLFHIFHFMVNRRYFQNVHPLFPIVDKDLVISDFEGSRDLPLHLAYSLFLAGSAYSDDPRLLSSPYSRTNLEKILKSACERAFELGKSAHLSLIQALILGQLYPAKRERKVALLAWTIDGRAVKLAMKRRLNVDPQKLGCESAEVKSRINMWWCVYVVDVWDAARGGRPPTIHEGSYKVPMPRLEESASIEEMFFYRLVSLTRILAQVLSFGYNNNQTSSALSSLEYAEEQVRKLRVQLADWYRSELMPRTPPSLLNQNLQVAYLSVVILLHRPLLPVPLAMAYTDPILLLVTRCASTIVQIAQANGISDAGTVPWRLFVPTVGYLTAGVTLAQNATWSVHIKAADGLRLSAQRDMNRLLQVFDEAQANGYPTAGMSGLLRNIFIMSGVELPALSDTNGAEVLGMGLPLPHEDPSFVAAQIRPIEGTDTRPPLPTPLAPGIMSAPSLSMSDPSHRKRKHSHISHLSGTSGKPLPQPLPSLANLPGIDSGRRSPTARSVLSLSTFSSHSSGSHGRPLYPLVPPPLAQATTYHHVPYATPSESPHSGSGTNRPPRQWEPTRPPSPPLPRPLYDRRYTDPQSTYSRDYPAQNPTYYPDRRETEYYPRSISPSHPYPPHEQPPPKQAQPASYSRAPYQPDPSTFHRPPPSIDPRYRNPTPPLSASAASNSPSWPSGYPYPQTGGPPRYEQPTSPRTVMAAPPPNNRWAEYYNSYPPQRS